MNILYEVIAGLVIVIATFFFGFYLGGLRGEVKDERTVVQQQTRNETAQKIEDSTIAIEAKTYEDAILQPVAAPVVRLCLPARAVPAARSAATKTHGEAPGRASDQPDLVQGPDIGRPLVTIGHGADAQIAGLQDYITRVCLAR